MRMHPNEYHCPEHPTIDLTARVRTALQRERMAVGTFFASQAAWELTEPHHFGVPVQCPGPTPESMHPVVLHGTLTP